MSVPMRRQAAAGNDFKRLTAGEDPALPIRRLEALLPLPSITEAVNFVSLRFPVKPELTARTV
jgi:hypothetical protein